MVELYINPRFDYLINCENVNGFVILERYIWLNLLKNGAIGKCWALPLYDEIGNVYCEIPEMIRLPFFEGKDELEVYLFDLKNNEISIDEFKEYVLSSICSTEIKQIVSKIVLIDRNLLNIINN